MRGYFGIAMYQPKMKANFGSLIRTANILECSFVTTIGARFKPHCSDTLKSHKHMPVFNFCNFSEFIEHLPFDCQIVGVEMGERSVPLEKFKHPQRVVYLLGSEDKGLPEEILSKCHYIVKLKGKYSMNVSVAGSIVLYHRGMTT